MAVPETVLAAFGCTAPPVALDGGQGITWRSGDVVLKPTGDPAETRWRASVLEALPSSPAFRVAVPVRAAAGDWVAEGWEAWHALPGHPDETRWSDVLRVSDAFHRALAGVPRPSFLDTRDDEWTHGERIAFGDVPVGSGRVLGELLGPLAAARRPIAAPPQMVHGDLLGNVLFATGVRPGIIDWPAYHRPARWACGVVVVDAVVWRDAPVSLLDEYAGEPDWYQLLVRALMFRIGVQDGRRARNLPIYEDRDDYQPTVDAVLARVS